LSFAVSYLSGVLGKASELHWQEAKHVLQYLMASKTLSLTFHQMPEKNFRLFGYCDASWASDTETRKSVTGYCFRMGKDDVNGFISWNSRKQPTVALSSCEAEYLAVSAAAQELVYLRSLLGEIGYRQEGSTTIYEDNNGCIDLANNPVGHKRTKHIDVRHHFIRQLVSDGTLELVYISTDEMIADLLTKPLQKVKNERFRDAMLA
jgi:hypothetical protein